MRTSSASASAWRGCLRTARLKKTSCGVADRGGQGLGGARAGGRDSPRPALRSRGSLRLAASDSDRRSSSGRTSKISAGAVGAVRAKPASALKRRRVFAGWSIGGRVGKPANNPRSSTRVEAPERIAPGARRAARAPARRSDRRARRGGVARCPRSQPLAVGEPAGRARWRLRRQARKRGRFFSRWRRCGKSARSGCPGPTARERVAPQVGRHKLAILRDAPIQIDKPERAVRALQRLEGGTLVRCGENSPLGVGDFEVA